MAAEATVYSRRLTIKLNDGTSSGKVLTKSVSFPSLARNDGLTDSVRNDAYLNLAIAYESIATKEIYRVEATKVDMITAA